MSSTGPTGQGTPGLNLQELEVLRGGYNGVLMREATRKALNDAYPGGAGFINGLLDDLYQGEGLSHLDRERCLIAVLAGRGEALTLGIHIYWGLMEGMSPDEVSHTLLLAGAYQGVPVYATGLLVLRKASAMLKGLAAEGSDAVASAQVLQKFVQTFS